MSFLTVAVVEEDNLAPGRKSIDELLKIRFNGKPTAAPMTIRGKELSQQEFPTISASEASQRIRLSTSRSDVSSFTTYSHPKGLNQQHFHASKVRVDYRLLKIKVELINMVLILPAYLVDFYCGATRSSAAVGPSNNEDHLARLRQAFIQKTHEADGSYPDAFIQMVQEAERPQEVLDCILLFESSIQSAALVGYQPSCLPMYAKCASAVAVRLYALDRAIRYEDIATLNLSCSGKYKPRIQFAPRCLVSSTCSKPLGHGGKCYAGFEGAFSRFQDILEDAPELRYNLVAPTYVVPSSLNYNVPTATSVQPKDQQGRYLPFPPAVKRPAIDERMDDAKRRVLQYDYDGIEIEHITPYVPKAHEMTSSVWV